MQIIRLISAAVAALAATTAHAQGDPAAGRQLYAARCSACHSLEYSGVGPTHKNLIGRRAGSVPGFSYSNALKGSSFTWNEEALSRWLTDPEKFVPGQKMFISIPDPRERADIVAFLLQAARPQTPSPNPPGK
jgi:cytochrome c